MRGWCIPPDYTAKMARRRAHHAAGRSEAFYPVCAKVLFPGDSMAARADYQLHGVVENLTRPNLGGGIGRRVRGDGCMARSFRLPATVTSRGVRSFRIRSVGLERSAEHRRTRAI